MEGLDLTTIFQMSFEPFPDEMVVGSRRTYVATSMSLKVTYKLVWSTVIRSVS